MAKVSFVTKQLEKAGFSVTFSGIFASATNPGSKMVLTFTKEGEEATCIKTAMKGEESNVMTDYFPGTYWDNIKNAIIHGMRE